MKIRPFLFTSILAAGIGVANLYAAECNVTHHQGSGGSTDVYMGYPATALYLFEGNYLDLSKMDQRDPAVQNVSSTDTAWVYRSELDSTMIVIVTEKVVKVARVTYSNDEDSRVDSLFTVKHKDVYKDEFPRLQKAGVFKGTAEQADSLVTHVFDLCQRFYNKEYGYTGCEFNPPEQRGRNGGKDVDMVDMPLALAAVAGEFTWLLDTLNYCPELKYPAADTTGDSTTTSLPGSSQSISSDSTIISRPVYNDSIANDRPINQPIDSPVIATDSTAPFIKKDTLTHSLDSGYYKPPTVKSVDAVGDSSTTSLKPIQAKAGFMRLGQKRYRIANVKPGSPYRVFSLNGQLLKSGVLEGDLFYAPTLPVILMFRDGQKFYIKD